VSTLSRLVEARLPARLLARLLSGIKFVRFSKGDRGGSEKAVGGYV